ncbi:MAG: hypothetical protein H7A50_13720 [Akkermansiaceae bacterium]|nr:hypothetical protein [Akkermansiaceae bacterium]
MKKPGAFTLLGILAAFATAVSAAPIDREALVHRHHPVIRGVDVDAPVSIGNGGFAFNADITGLQTLADEYHRNGVPAETLCRWAWYSEANPEEFTLPDASKPFTRADGKVINYPTQQSTAAGDWLRRNPRSHPLARISFERTAADAKPISPADITDPEQSLDLWNGVIESRFTLDGETVRVTTTCHPEQDLVAVRIESGLLESGALAVRFAFPCGHDAATKLTPALDWSHPESHETTESARSPQRVDLRRKRDSLVYQSSVAWEGAGNWESTAPHTFRLSTRARGLAFVAAFSPGSLGRLPDFAETRRAAVDHWNAFWKSGAAVDFSGSSDPRAAEIEKRIVLSRYLMAAQCAGAVPPQESGLTCNTWYGKHHTEMIWWHTAHFPLWGNDDLLEKNLAWYRERLPQARALAESRGLRGARWAKMVGPDARESPGGNPLIIWNQPHCIYLSELLYRNDSSKEILGRYKDLVFETADCLASMAFLDKKRGRYVLGPPLWIAQEIYDQATSQNPGFELAYWRWALETANQWRERLGMPREETWDHVVRHLSPLPVKDGKYVALESHPDTWDNIDSRHDHPTMLAPLGILPGGPMVDRETMNRTLDAVLAEWDWETKIWGWDYPMIAMTATRLGRPETAVEILLREGPNNLYLPTGHCPQRSDVALPKDAPPGARKREIAAYLPANGAFLSAVALMVAGWDGCETEHPGFPKDGRWKIRAEGLHPLP